MEKTVFDIKNYCKENFTKITSELIYTCNECKVFIKSREIFFNSSDLNLINICQNCYETLPDKMPFEIKIGTTVREIKDNFKPIELKNIYINVLDDITLCYERDLAVFSDNQCLLAFKYENGCKKVVKILGNNKSGDLVLEVN